MAKFVWNTVFFAFGIKPPANVIDMLGSWLKVYSQKLRKKILIGAAAICWAIWLCKNDAVFNRELIPAGHFQRDAQDKDLVAAI